MKILELLNKKYFLIIFFLLIGLSVHAEEQPADIWNIEKKKIEEKILEKKIETSENNNKIKKNFDSSVYNLQAQEQISTISFENNLEAQEIKIIGLYDPEDYDLDINMWTNSDGDQLKTLIKKLNKMNLSKDAIEIVNISLLTNAYLPQKNISEKEFLKFKSDWLIKNSNLSLIEEYLIQNQAINLHPELTRYIVDEYLSNTNIDKACEIFIKNTEMLDDEYLSKFNIYCLIKNNKREEAQLILDLKKELGFKDEYFEKKIDYLLEYSTKIDDTVSEKSILDFYLAHQTNPNFNFEPNDKTKKIIWKYLSSANLLNSFQEIDISEIEKISTIEKAVHNKNYPEKDLFNLYKRFQFNFNQLLNAKEVYKTLPNIEGRALIYQKILLESEMVEKLKLLKILKTSFENEELDEAFDVELKTFLEKINPTDIPDNLTSFYYTNIKIQKEEEKKIKFNNDIIHQSKLINYFNGDYAKSKISKDTNNLLKKIKKDKKYFLSKKDIIFLESLKYDGVEISEKYNELYKTNDDEIPTDIQIMINNSETGLVLLRIAEVIGQDKIERIDDDTIYFIITALNKLNIDWIRNKILLKVLPLKV
ncbi:hypothetical protein [Candidatus Pelagibacter sp. HIMB1483]|uniref:hypothetical protein n=1 Tax=Candidatus Pelagibacter sp. HIMB1483 TaxID=3415414 RepID=UPI003F834E20